jgi:amino acid transporter
MSIRNKFIRSKDEGPRKSTMEAIFGEKALRLFPACVILILLGGAMTTSNSTFKGLLSAVIFGITIIFAIYALYKIVRFKCSLGVKK